MTSVTEVSRRRAAPALGTFERYLTVWVALCIVTGIGVLVEVPVMLSVLRIVLRSRTWYERVYSV